MADMRIRLRPSLDRIGNLTKVRRRERETPTSGGRQGMSAPASFRVGIRAREQGFRGHIEEFRDNQEDFLEGLFTDPADRLDRELDSALVECRQKMAQGYGIKAESGFRGRDETASRLLPPERDGLLLSDFPDVPEGVHGRQAELPELEPAMREAGRAVFDEQFVESLVADLG